jgi:hypothetical protein
MAVSYDLKKLAPVHIQMMDYIQANPGCKLEDVAAACGGYSIGWISQIVNSDAFQAMLKERQVEVFGELKMTIKDRVVGLAHLSLKRLEEKIPVEQDVDKVANVADLALKALGFGPKGPNTPGAPGVGNQQNNFFIGTVDKETLEHARSLMPQRQLPEKVVSEETPAAAEK